MARQLAKVPRRLIYLESLAFRYVSTLIFIEIVSTKEGTLSLPGLEIWCRAMVVHISALADGGSGAQGLSNKCYLQIKPIYLHEGFATGLAQSKHQISFLLLFENPEASLACQYSEGRTLLGSQSSGCGRQGERDKEVHRGCGNPRSYWSAGSATSHPRAWMKVWRRGSLMCFL